MSEKLWYKLTRTIVKAGKMPFPISDTLIELLKLIITEHQAEFIVDAFKRKPNLNMEEIKKRIDWDESKINDILEELQYNGIIAGTKSRSTGIIVYRLQPPFPGLFEFQLMRPGETEKEKKLARLFDNLFNEMSKLTQENYDKIIPQYKNFPPVDRVVPVEEQVEPREEVVLPTQDVKEMVDKNDNIAVALCYCRHEKDLLGEPCKLDAPRNNCLMFGKTAEFCVEKDFAKPISKEEAKKILAEAEDYGLVHKAFHIHQNPERSEEAICSCCSCCCGVFQMFHKGIMPFYTVSSYIALVEEEDCIGCGTCIEKCPMEAIELEDTIAIIEDERCIGCGVCTHFCPEDALMLKETEELRRVFIPPPIIKQHN